MSVGRAKVFVDHADVPRLVALFHRINLFHVHLSCQIADADLFAYFVLPNVLINYFLVIMLLLVD